MTNGLTLIRKKFSCEIIVSLETDYCKELSKYCIKLGIHSYGRSTHRSHAFVSTLAGQLLG